MTGHIRKRGKNWAVVIDLGRDANGKRRQRWHTVHGTKDDAERERARLVHEHNTGSYIQPSQITLGEYLLQWLKRRSNSNLTKKTASRYEEIITNNLIPNLGKIKLQKLEPGHIEAYYDKMYECGRKDGRGGLSRQTVRHHHNLLHKALNDAVTKKLITFNPAAAVERPVPSPSERSILTEEEVAHLLLASKRTRLYLPILIAVTTGLRRGEIFALRWRDVDFDNMRLSVTRSLEQVNDNLYFKGPKTPAGKRSVALPAITADALREHKVKQARVRLKLGPAYEGNGLICARPDGRPWKPDTFSSDYAEFIKRLPITRVSYHDLRHSHASHLGRYKVPPKVVSERLGHSSIKTTMDLYSHTFLDMQEEAAKATDKALRDAMRELGEE